MTLDKQSKDLLNMINQTGIIPFYQRSPQENRALNKKVSQPFPPEQRRQVGSIQDRLIPTPNGDTPVRIYRPINSTGTDVTLMPAVLYFHGGGFFLGDIEDYDHLTRELCERTGMMVISVDYPLAPEHPFPAAPEASYAVLEWVAANAMELGIDHTRIGLMGDSAGGNLSAVLSIMSRDRGGPAIAVQVLLYPGIALRDGESFASRDGLGGGEYYLLHDDIKWMMSHYLRTPEEANDYRDGPLKAESLEGLPPALIITAGYDPLVDEGAFYAKKLDEAGVPVEYTCYETTIHGFVSMFPALEVGDQALSQACRTLQTYLK